MLLGAMSLLGRIAELIAKYLQSKHLARDADKRGQACNSIVRLYYLLVDLKSLAEYVAESAKMAVRDGKPSLLAYTFRDTKRRIQSTSNDFVEAFHSIYQALEIFAPELGNALSAVTGWKLNLLWEISNYVVFEQEAEHLAIRKLKYLQPDERLLSLDIDSYVKRLVASEAAERAPRFEWPETLFYSGSLDGFSPAQLEFVDFTELQNFATMLEQHIAVLNQGILALRKYIRTTFTIEEVLYEKIDIAPELFG
jgi:hypothetical protein